MLVLPIVVIARLRIHPDGCEIVVGVKAEAPDGAIVAETILWLLRVIAGEDYGDIIAVIQLSCTWRVGASGKPSDCVADYRLG